MKKNQLLGVIALAILTMMGCSNDETNETLLQNNAIEFSTYLGRNSQTKGSAFETDDMYTMGFGVYAYYTGTTLWESFGSKGDPNYMINTKVTSSNSGTTWSYAPLKYWPNGDGDKISFFAYAPWQAGNTGDLIQFSTTDAAIDFSVAGDVTKQIDLTWNSNATIDQTKGILDQKISFNFKHALARLDFTIQAAVDQVDVGGTIAEGTTITLNKIVLGTEQNGFYTGGTLALIDGTWSNQTGEQAFTLTDANFKTGSNVLTTTNAKSNLIDPAGDDYIMIIPENMNNLSVYVEYEVKTEGTNAAEDADNSTIINKITNKISSVNFQQGKAYTLNLILGMSSVELTAAMDGWGASSEKQIDLPLNKMTP